MSPWCTKIAITRSILRLQDSSFACKPDFTRRKNYLLFQRAKEEGGRRQGGIFNDEKKSFLIFKKCQKVSKKYLYPFKSAIQYLNRVVKNYIVMKIGCEE